MRDRCEDTGVPPTRRVLIVAYYFPPIGGIGSIRLQRFASLLPAEGWEPTVLAPRDTPHPSDPHLRFPEDRVVRSRSIELSQVGRTAVGALSGGASSAAREPMGSRGRSDPPHTATCSSPTRRSAGTRARSRLAYPCCGGSASTRSTLPHSRSRHT